MELYMSFCDRLAVRLKGKLTLVGQHQKITQSIHCRPLELPTTGDHLETAFLDSLMKGNRYHPNRNVCSLCGELLLLKKLLSMELT